MNANRILEDIVVASLEKCVGKLSKISAGRWSLTDVGVAWGTLSEITLKRRSAAGGIAVYFEVGGDCPFTAMIIFRTEDVELISKCFIGFAFPRMADINQAEELLLSELGNIILNSFVSGLSNSLRRSFIPSVPKCIKGEPMFLLEALATALDKKQKYSLVSVMLNLQCDSTVIHSEVVGIIPAKLEGELEKAGKKI
jgi:chemotaxis protein CheY-P-specific phosphatase CheC